MSKMEHTELPWKVGMHAYRDTVYDKYGRRVLFAESEEDAAFAAEAANEYEELQQEAERLRDGNEDLKVEVEAVKKLVRRFMGVVNHLAPALTGVALMHAEVEGAADMPKPELVSKGYKRIAELMKEAYAATGEEAPE